MATKRNLIETFREMLRERNADSTYTNQFLYSILSEHAKWLIRREVSAGRIYVNNSIFQTLSCVDVIEVSTIDECCPIKTNCKIYRTKNKLPDMWIDNSGPVLKSVSSVDGSTDFFYTNATTWQSKRNDPYNRMSNMKYTFFSDNYLWFPEHNPHKVNIYGFFQDDLALLERTCEDCEDTKPCVRFLDTAFTLPEWLEAEMLSKSLQEIAGITKKLPEDVEINKNEKRKG